MTSGKLCLFLFSVFAAGFHMGLDKLKVITPRLPHPDFFAMLNDELRRAPEERHFEFQFRYAPGPLASIDPKTRAAVWTKSGIRPFFRVELQFMAPGGKLPPLTTVETNPNNFPAGYRGVTALLRIVFGEAHPDLKISRIDCNADVPDVSVEYIRRSLRIAGKRKTGDVGKLNESYSSCGVQTFYVGKSPAQLRVYDKIEELKYHREDTSSLPSVLTRIEWEFRERRCPVHFWGEFPQMLEVQPFARIQFLESSQNYNFRHFTNQSLTLFAYNKLAEEKGAHEAIRIFNKASGRHFARNLKEDIAENPDLKQQFQASYYAGTKAFFENRGADVRTLFGDVVSSVPSAELLSLDAAAPIELAAGEMKPLLGATEAEALAIAAAGRRPELLQEARIFDENALEGSALFAAISKQSTLFDPTKWNPEEK